MTYQQFFNRFTRLLNKVFDQEMYDRFILANSMLEPGESILDKFMPTVEHFGSVNQVQAYKQLIELIKTNPGYRKVMHYVSSAKA